MLSPPLEIYQIQLRLVPPSADSVSPARQSFFCRELAVRRKISCEHRIWARPREGTYELQVLR